MLQFENIRLLKVPARFAEATFDDKTNESLRKVGELFLTNFEACYDRGLGPAFFGPPGIGKTYVAAIIARTLQNDMGVPTYWASTVRVLNRLMDLRDFRRTEEYGSLKSVLVTAPVLVLDDFGHMQEYTRTRELLYEIVDARYASKKPVIFTANVDIAPTACGPNMSTTFWQAVAELSSPAIARRIKVMSKGLVFAGVA